MAKVKLTTSRAGATFSQACGDVIEVSEREAAVLIERGQAVPHVDEVPKAKGKRRTATKGPTEKRTDQDAVDVEDPGDRVAD